MNCIIRSIPGVEKGATMSRVLVACGWILFLIGAAFSSAQAYEQRINTISVGLQGGGGLLLRGQGQYVAGTSTYDFGNYIWDNSGEGDPISAGKFWKHNWGSIISLRFRYSLDRSHAIGLSLEDVRFNKRAHPRTFSDLQAVPRQYQANNYIVDYYAYFNRRSQVCSYLVLGAGVHKDTLRGNKGDEAILLPTRFCANLGLGLEYFVRRPFALDGSLRAYYLSGNGGSNIATELQVGFQYYLLH
jgi:hypothetical protein